VKVAGYVRVSGDDQAREGVSLGVKVEKIRLYAELHALELVEVLSDPGVSAKTLERPGLSRALAMLDAGRVGGLVVFKLDRLTRNLGDWSALIDRYFGEKGGRSLMSVSESVDTRTAAGRMVLNIMTTVAQWERETIVERTRSAMSFKRSKGERLGQIPFGQRLVPDGRTLEVDPAETAVIAAARGMRAEGWSYRQIARELDSRGVRPKRGGPRWNQASVRHLIRIRSDP
jgi:DNA invertase Pin-like site-specific DNA recombinase